MNFLEPADDYNEQNRARERDDDRPPGLYGILAALPKTMKTTTAQFAVRREAWLDGKVEELTNHQRRIAGTAEAALVEVHKAQIRLSQASNFLAVRGTGCAPIRLIEARERINAALVILEDEK